MIPKQEGIAELRQGIADWHATGAEIWLLLMLVILAEAHGKVRQLREGVAMIAETLAATQENGEVWYDAKLYRLKGELTLQQQSKVESRNSSTSKAKPKRVS